MKERPILFSAPMVLAILTGKKTQTRRVMEPQPPNGWFRDESELSDRETTEWLRSRCPYGAPGDRLWVRETLEHAFIEHPSCDYVIYKADGERAPVDTWIWKRRVLPSIHMPRGASRITLEVTGVRVDRLHAITEGDARAEGVAPFRHPSGTVSYRDGFARLWSEFNGTFDENVWVWVVEFKRVERAQIARSA